MAGRMLAAIAVTATLLVSTASAASFTESIDSTWADRWHHSSLEKYNGKFVAEAPPGSEDVALKVTEKARHYGIATALPEVTDPSQGLALQYDVKFTDGLTCGGAYMKFLTADADVKFEELNENSTYSVMFGPDKCGTTNKVHLILRHKSPLTGEIEEKHLVSPPMVQLDEYTHVYTAVLNPFNNTYAVLIDGNVMKQGSLFEDFDPPFNPPEEIDDPEDTKPADWVDVVKIADPEATKPDDWDEDAPREIPDEEAVKPEGWLEDEQAEIDDTEAKQPEDWDEEEDGVWEPPRIANPLCKDAPGCGEWTRPNKPNPAYKGKWVAPLIDNPDYKGPWSPKKMPNPKYYKDEAPLANIGKINAAAIEIWTMDNAYYFDDIVVTNDPDVAVAFKDKTWGPKHEAEEAVKAAKKAKEEAEAAVAKAASETSDKVNKVIDTIFEKLPFLEAHRDSLQPTLDFLTERPFRLYTALGLPTLGFLLLLFNIFFAKKKPVRDAVAKAKKDDTATPDDAAPVTTTAADDDKTEEEEIEEIEAEAEAEAKATRKRPGRPRRET